MQTIKIYLKKKTNIKVPYGNSYHRSIKKYELIASLCMYRYIELKAYQAVQIFLSIFFIELAENLIDRNRNDENCLDNRD
jgi:hypothetical protein